MSRWMTLLVMAALVAACADNGAAPAVTTTTVVTTTSETPSTTLPDVTGITEAPTTTEAVTTTTAGPTVTVVEIRVEGGRVTRVERFDAPLDGAVRIVVTADVADEIHVHGYDLHADVTPDREAVVEFDATIPGIFEIELEAAGVLIGELQVAP